MSKFQPPPSLNTENTETSHSERWVRTRDGSLSCREPESGLLCHNRAGAFLEATENYAIPSGLTWPILMQANRHHQMLHVLDACYGLGYNTWALIERLMASCSELDSERISIESPLLRFTAIEKSPDMLKLSAEILSRQGIGNLHSFISPLEHNAYYRTLCYLLENGRTRFKVGLILANDAEVDHADTLDSISAATGELKQDRVSLRFQFYIPNAIDGSWLPFSLPIDC